MASYALLPAGSWLHRKPTTESDTFLIISFFLLFFFFKKVVDRDYCISFRYFHFTVKRGLAVRYNNVFTIVFGTPGKHPGYVARSQNDCERTHASNKEFMAGVYSSEAGRKHLCADVPTSGSQSSSAVRLG